MVFFLYVMYNGIKECDLDMVREQDIHNTQEEQDKQKEPTRRQKAVQWMKDHKGTLTAVGIGVGAFIAAAILKSYDDDESEDGRVADCGSYTGNYFRKSSVEELEKEREKVQQDYLNPDLDIEYRGHLYDVLHRFDNEIGKKKWDGKEPGYPVHSEHGWYLPSDD